MKKRGHIPWCFAAWWICTTVYLQSSGEQNSLLQFENKQTNKQKTGQIKTNGIQG